MATTAVLFKAAEDNTVVEYNRSQVERSDGLMMEAASTRNNRVFSKAIEHNINRTKVIKP
ncbi:hypothetical protein AALB_1986 [Agarivorans albus MKT 106]|uniref:Uncharacterized protein n=1 Tax=Agarivorans albus MKT 106 TaxID=1331007 RepID=R9PT70_AGAAL|nr:hypothetical protein AALB_1986 [Agarivorans albus MKT 106]